MLPESGGDDFPGSGLGSLSGRKSSGVAKAFQSFVGNSPLQPLSVVRQVVACRPGQFHGFMRGRMDAAAGLHPARGISSQGICDFGRLLRLKRLQRDLGGSSSCHA